MGIATIARRAKTTRNQTGSFIIDIVSGTWPRNAARDYQITGS
jgi:hypothetical protein